MNRRRALVLVSGSAVAMVATSVLIALLIGTAVRFGGSGTDASLIAGLTLLVVLIFLITVLVLMYAVYALLRGLRPRGAGGAN